MAWSKSASVGLVGCVMAGWLTAGCVTGGWGARRSSCPAPPMSFAFAAPASPLESFSRMSNALWQASIYQQCVAAERREREAARRIAELEREAAELREAVAEARAAAAPVDATRGATSVTARAAAPAELAPNPY